MRTIPNTEIVVSTGPVAKRRHRSNQERRAVVEETFRPGASVALIARSHGVNANQVFHWRKLYNEGRLGAKPTSAELLPVRVHEVMEDKPALTPPQTGVIHIEHGRTRIRFEGAVDTDALRTILEQFGR